MQLRIPATLLVVILFSFLVYLFSAGSSLPDPVATHFGGDNMPNDYMSRSAVIAIFGALGIALPLFLILVAATIRFLPAQFVNIPHREYWLAAERKSETMMFIAQHILWLSCLIVLFLSGTFHLIIRANAVTPVQLPTQLTWIVVGCFLAGLAAWCIVLVHHFGKGRITRR